MFSESAHLYDAIYTRMKSYEDEAATIAERIRALHPDARTVLDVACGTGEHDRFLSLCYEVDGVDLEPAFVDLARTKNPRGRYEVADMCAFDLGRRYDAVLCLFSSIGYTVTLERLHAAASSLALHVAPGGLALVEPWFPPDRWNPGRVYMTTIDDPDLKVCRMNISETKGERESSFEFHYLVGRPDGVRHFTELHTLGLFTVPEMTDALSATGLAVDYEEPGITGRGLYVCRRK